MTRLTATLAGLLCIAGCGSPASPVDSGPRADGAVAVDAGPAGGVCTWSGERACLDALEAAAACWQASGACTTDTAAGTFSFESGATATTSGTMATYAMNGTTCFSAQSGSTLTYMTPGGDVWTAVVASDGASAEWTCPGGATVTVQTNEQPDCLTASTSAANTALATCF